MGLKFDPNTLLNLLLFGERVSSLHLEGWSECCFKQKKATRLHFTTSTAKRWNQYRF
jgi:hypothetical protein